MPVKGLCIISVFYEIIHCNAIANIEKIFLALCQLHYLHFLLTNMFKLFVLYSVQKTRNRV